VAEGANNSAVALWRGGDWRTLGGPRQSHGMRADNRLLPFSGGRVAINGLRHPNTVDSGPMCKIPGGPHWSRGLGQAAVNWVGQHPTAATGPRSRLQGRTSNLEPADESESEGRGP